MKWRNSKERELMKSKNLTKPNQSTNASTATTTNTGNNFDYNSKINENVHFEAEKMNKNFASNLIENNNNNNNCGLMSCPTKISLNCCVNSNGILNQHHQINPSLLVPPGNCLKEHSPSYHSSTSPRSSSCLTSPVSSVASLLNNQRNPNQTNAYLTNPTNNTSDVEYNEEDDYDLDDDDDDESDIDDDGEFDLDKDNVENQDSSDDDDDINENIAEGLKNNYLKLKMMRELSESRLGVNKK